MSVYFPKEVINKFEITEYELKISKLTSISKYLKPFKTHIHIRTGADTRRFTIDDTNCAD